MCALVTGVQTCALPIWLARRLQALQHDLELLILGPASPPTRLHNFQPLNLGTALITVHKDSSQHHASPWQGGLPQMLIPRWTGRSCILRANAPALAAIVRDGQRDASACSAFNAAIAAAIDELGRQSWWERVCQYV